MFGERPQPPSAMAMSRQSRDSMRQACPYVKVVSQLPEKVPSSFWKSQAYAAGDARASVATIGSERTTDRRIRSYSLNSPEDRGTAASHEASAA